MTSFDAHDEGTDEALWADAWPHQLPTIEELSRGDRLLVVAAHPDDETLGAGGLIATAAELGLAVTVVVATDGEASHPQSTTHPPARLAEIRRGELTAALQLLHPRAELRFLGLPDSGLARLEIELIDLVAKHGVGATHVITPWAGDRHPDHAACARAGGALARVNDLPHWQFPIWAWHWSRPDSPALPRRRMKRFELGPRARQAKALAIAAHRSQHEPLSTAAGDEALLTPSMLAHFDRPYEVFVVTAPTAADNEYFEELYQRELDPWALGERFYERRKRAMLLTALPRERFRRAFEPGCATGLLTAELARRCDEVVAWDGVRSAVDQTVARVRDLDAQVTVERARIPSDWPHGRFDLIVLSEVGYYCSDLRQLQHRIGASLSDDGVLIACHWRHAAPDHPVSAEMVHAVVGLGMVRIAAHEEADFVLDVWTRDGRSVAATEGLLG